MRSEIVCAIQECQAPCEDCTPIWNHAKDSCCPEKYECCKLLFFYVFVVVKCFKFAMLQ